tara:strand:+ start:128 stop:538 length:411 start_codon:yes stop_codon:yes gene_type:complete
MSAELQSIDEAITASYQSASQVETQARQLEARISKIGGTKHHLPARRYGQPVDLGKIRSNLTLTSLIAQNSAELAHYFGIDPGIRHRIDEEKEARAMAAQSLQMRTEALRATNQAAAQHREQNLVQGRNPLTGGLF